MSIGIGSNLLSCVASVNNVFLTVSPATRFGFVVDDGRVNILMISPAACFRWSDKFTSGDGVDIGKHVNLSQSLSVLVRGK